MVVMIILYVRPTFTRQQLPVAGYPVEGHLQSIARRIHVIIVVTIIKNLDTFYSYPRTEGTSLTARRDEYLREHVLRGTIHPKLHAEPLCLHGPLLGRFTRP